MDHAHNRKDRILLAVIAMIVVHIAVSVYGVIRDMTIGTTVFVISSDLPPVEGVERATPFPEKIKSFFYPPAKKMAPIERLVNIKGRVIYTDGSPYANGLVELRSEPRLTYTNSEGCFYFEDVEDGEHIISILDQNRIRLAGCKVNVNRSSVIADALLMQTDINAYVLEVAIDVKLIEIVLEIPRDSSGQPTGQLIIRPEVNVLERYLPEEQPATPPVTPPVIPPVTPPNVALRVYSTVDAKDFNKAPAAAAEINIFGRSKRIAPGMTGLHKFAIDNTANPFAIIYDIDILETNNSLNIPMKYRLYNNKTSRYVNGDANWYTTAEIRAVTANPAQPFSMSDSMKNDYTLEWFWDDSGISDNSITEHAGDVVCTLTIRVSARRR